MKRFFVGALTVAVIGGACLTGCSGNYSETYEGDISSLAYITELAAAEAFVKNEIVGKTTETTEVSYEKAGDLSLAKVATFNLGDYDVDDVTEAEYGTVTYTTKVYSLKEKEPDEDSASESTPENTTESEIVEETVEKTVTMYLLKFGSTYHYYVPQPEVGDMLSESYYDSVFDSSEYSNCTVSIDIGTRVSVSRSFSVDDKTEEQVEVNKTDYSVYMKITEDVIYIKIMDKESTSGTETDGKNKIYARTGYIFRGSNDSLSLYYYENKSWNNYTTISRSTLHSMYDYGIPVKFDHSYFEKTKTGFKLSDDKLVDFVEKMLTTNSSLSKTFKMTEATFTGDATYQISGGKLAKQSMNMSIKSTDTKYDATYVKTGEVFISAKYSRFGTTTVKVPEDLEYKLP